MLETKSNWECVSRTIQNQKPIHLGRYASYWFHRTPRRMLNALSYYKFAAKMIGKGKRVLDVGCNEGIGTYLIAKECGLAHGVDFDAEAIGCAKKNYGAENLTFAEGDFLNESPDQWDAVVNFDVIEHIMPENASRFFQQICHHLTPEGMAIIGTPSLISQQFASPISKQGHVNVYSPQRLEAEMKKHFSFVFLFAANDEVVHTGFLELAHYLIAIGCGKKT